MLSVTENISSNPIPIDDLRPLSRGIRALLAAEGAVDTESCAALSRMCRSIMSHYGHPELGALADYLDTLPDKVALGGGSGMSLYDVTVEQNRLAQGTIVVSSSELGNVELPIGMCPDYARWEGGRFSLLTAGEGESPLVVGLSGVMTDDEYVERYHSEQGPRIEV